MFKRGKHAAEEELPVEEVADVEVIEEPVEALPEEEGDYRGREEQLDSALSALGDRAHDLESDTDVVVGEPSQVTITNEALKRLSDAVGEELMPVPESTATSPSYYQYPGGIQMRDITRWHTGNGAQAIQYIGRATRFDLVTKSHSEEGRIEDIDKAINFLEDEKKRLKGEF